MIEKIQAIVSYRSLLFADITWDKDCPTPHQRGVSGVARERDRKRSENRGRESERIDERSDEEGRER